MSYEVAIGKAWQELLDLKPKEPLTVKFFTDEYGVDLKNRKVLSLSCNVPAKDFTAILLLHYCIKRIQGLPSLSGEWISFKELDGGESYFPAFRKRSIEPIIRKYGTDPAGLFTRMDALGARKIEQADAAIAFDIFERVPVMVELWRGDDEFGPEANLLFDTSISGIFCTEDVAVLTGFIAKYI